MSDQALAEAYLRQQQGATTTPYAAAQQLYFEQCRTAKRGPPTPGFSSTGLTTPLGSEPTAPAPEEASGSQATPPAQGFVQAFQVQDDVALQLTAAQAGVNPQDTGALRTWLGGTVTTRATVLETIRHYHKAVIRPELYNLVTQVEQALIRVDDRVLRQQADLDWMCSENRTTQKQASGLQVLLSGFPADFTPQERFYMINWLLEQITVAQHFLTARGYPAEGELRFLNCLQSDPSTPPAGPLARKVLSLGFWPVSFPAATMTSRMASYLRDALRPIGSLSARQFATASGKPLHGQRKPPMRMTTEEAFVKTLQMHGIKNAFGIIGSAMMPISDLFPAAGIKFWDCAHECNAGMMADGYTRTTGKMSMMIAQNGPGITNFVTPVKTAYWNHTPLLLVTPQAANKTIGQGGFQEVEQMAMFKDTVCYQEEVRDPTRICEVLNRVIEKAYHCSAPAQINIPRDFWTQVVDMSLPTGVKLERSAGGASSTKAAAEMLAEAKFPVILNGAGAILSGAVETSVKLAERLSAPVCCNYQVLQCLMLAS
ncbi:putative sulfoacetaldehyde acetyltransferase [Symbiodinium microadriaticum]|uniref:Putative sulfoacetaldehyde acetyltransferase n=1 Tax=Symbiodinium microadriaticum TaxID=2951 RepID=A0A1Q9DBW2_SYMMI|nr:putative sulfoacetaldehyde acetyltransferase [Symbiodinium microadriaticum]